jgi:hypothetical protein
MSLPSNRNINSWEALNRQIEVIYRVISKIQPQVKSITSVLTSSDGTMPSILGTPYRKGKQILSTGTTFIPFIKDIGTSNYNLLLELYTADGTAVGYPVKNIPKTSTGFTLTVGELTIIEYVAIP